MENQLSFGVEREVLADELQYYFEQSAAADIVDEDFSGADSRGKANGILRRLEFYGWIEIETDKSYVQRVNFKDYSVKLIRTLLDISEESRSSIRDISIQSTAWSGRIRITRESY